MKDPKYDPDLPTTHRATDRIWRTSPVLPMGGRIILERMTCSSTEDGAKGSKSDVFIRVNINDDIVPLPHCKSGQGLSCPLDQFNAHVRRRKLEVGDFGKVCGLDGDVGRITFLHQD